VCTIGTQPNPLIDELPCAKSRGRLVVNADLSVSGVAGLWAAGDCAAAVNAFDGKLAPPTAQFAEAQARQLAANIVGAASRQADARLSLSAKRAALLDWPQQRGGRNLRVQALRFRCLALVARRLPVACADVREEDAAISGMELGDVFPAGYFPFGLPTHPATRSCRRDRKPRCRSRRSRYSSQALTASQTPHRSRHGAPTSPALRALGARAPPANRPACNLRRPPLFLILQNAQDRACADAHSGAPTKRCGRNDGSAKGLAKR
jgi:hypothetical protein